MATIDPHNTSSIDFPSRTEEAAAATKQETIEPTKTERAQSTGDPFASQRTHDNDPFSRSLSAEPDSATSPSSGDRRMSKEWDAAKVPPSRFQRREGSIFSTSSSRDSHITRKDRDSAYHAKLKEKFWMSCTFVSQAVAGADNVYIVQGWM
ncbi:hypothetical protein ACJ72_01653 [Emergomyces africanus]|uniref:Uncharacterized protein n=1 Tax=Emergomyces africanus TaxID=1955775 RepID=A0A1B7P4P0_9EURO|nr:hypothetical protein ACJ72_01653 [Emergomyces africanus]